MFNINCSVEWYEVRRILQESVYWCYFPVEVALAIYGLGWTWRCQRFIFLLCSNPAHNHIRTELFGICFKPMKRGLTYPFANEMDSQARLRQLLGFRRRLSLDASFSLPISLSVAGWSSRQYLIYNFAMNTILKNWKLNGNKAIKTCSFYCIWQFSWIGDYLFVLEQCVCAKTFDASTNSLSNNQL